LVPEVTSLTSSRSFAPRRAGVGLLSFGSLRRNWCSYIPISVVFLENEMLELYFLVWWFHNVCCVLASCPALDTLSFCFPLKRSDASSQYFLIATLYLISLLSVCLVLWKRKDSILYLDLGYFSFGLSPSSPFQSRSHDGTTTYLLSPINRLFPGLSALRLPVACPVGVRLLARTWIHDVAREVVNRECHRAGHIGYDRSFACQASPLSCLALPAASSGPVVAQRTIGKRSRPLDWAPAVLTGNERLEPPSCLSISFLFSALPFQDSGKGKWNGQELKERRSCAACTPDARDPLPLGSWVGCALCDSA